MIGFPLAEPAVVTALPYDADREADRDFSMSKVSSEDTLILPHLELAASSGDNLEEPLLLPIPAPIPLGLPPQGGGAGLLRRPPMIETTSSRRRAYSSGATPMGAMSFARRDRDSISPSDFGSISSYPMTTTIGPARGTPRRGSIFTSKSIHRDVGGGSSDTFGGGGGGSSDKFEKEN
jgi:hypothetical protein